jgi:hypothetical protein
MPKNSINRLSFNGNYSIQTLDVYNTTNKSLIISMPSDVDNVVIEIAYSGGANIPSVWNLSPTTSGTSKLLPGNGWATGVLHYDGSLPTFQNSLRFTVNINGSGIPGNPTQIWAKVEIGYKKNINAISPTIPSYYTSYTEYFIPGSYTRDYTLILAKHW